MEREKEEQKVKKGSWGEKGERKRERTKKEGAGGRMNCFFSTPFVL